MRSCSSLIPPLRAGLLAKTRGVFPFPLPRGLVDGQVVTVERVEEGQCTVRDSSGSVWTVPAVSLDSGQLVWHDGEWVPRD